MHPEPGPFCIGEARALTHSPVHSWSNSHSAPQPSPASNTCPAFSFIQMDGTPLYNTIQVQCRVAAFSFASWSTLSVLFAWPERGTGTVATAPCGIHLHAFALLPAHADGCFQCKAFSACSAQPTSRLPASAIALVSLWNHISQADISAVRLAAAHCGRHSKRAASSVDWPAAPHYEGVREAAVWVHHGRKLQDVVYF